MNVETRSNRMLEIFAGSFQDAVVVSSFLESCSIKCTIQNYYMGTIAPWYIEAGGSPVKVFVSENNYSEARKLLEEHNDKKA